MSKKVYIDMDGTLCRFHDIEHHYIEQMWEQGFYVGLQPFEEFVNAVSLCIDRNPDTEFYILSAVLDTEPPFVAEEKREWIKRYLPQLPDKRLIFVPAGADKSQFIGGIDEECCLIDDYNKNLREWEQAGGLPIKFINDVNNRGLGAYGGEKGQLWNGLSIDYNQSAMSICLQIEKCVGMTPNGERSNEYYGFSNDVLPEEFIPLVRPYFQMRSACDEQLRKNLYQNIAILNDYSTATNKDRDSIINSQSKRIAISNFAKENNINQFMIDCLENCYITAVANGISADNIENWIESSINNGKAFSTYPITPSNIIVYINSKTAQEERINALYGEIRALSAKQKKISRQLYLPVIDEVAKNLLTNGCYTKSLNDKNEILLSQIKGLSDEWHQLTGTSYPNVKQGTKEHKYSPAKESSKNSPTK